jgi:hypothetical protein
MNSINKYFILLISLFVFGYKSVTAQIVANRDSFYFVSGVCSTFDPKQNDSGFIVSLTYSAIIDSTHGFLNYSNNTFNFCPNNIYSGIDSFQYTICNQNNMVCKTTMVILYTSTNNANNIWSGDINKDGICNSLDILLFPQFLNATGPKRNVTNTVWESQETRDWKSSFWMFDHKYGDVDGSGIITLNDTSGIMENYGKSHSLSQVNNYSPYYNNKNPIPLMMTLSKDTMILGDTLLINISLGKSDSQALNIQGISYNIDGLELAKTSLVSYQNNGWLQGGVANLYSNNSFNFSNRNFEMVHTALDASKKSGDGIIATIKVIIDEHIIQIVKDKGGKGTLYFKDVYILENSGSTKLYNYHTKSAPVFIKGYKASIEENKMNFNIFPNPVLEYLTIESTEEILSLRISNILNQTKEIVCNPNNGKYLIHSDNLYRGLNLIDVKTLFNTFYNKIIKH